MKILLIGDIVGKAGVEFISRRLWSLRSLYGVDLVIANGENASPGNGLLPGDAKALLTAGVDIITTGNHVFGRKELRTMLDEEPALLRPHNYPDAPGTGLGIYQTPFGKVAVLNLIGRAFLASVDCPFRAADRALASLGDDVKVRIVDFHAEATSEKLALFAWLDGRVSAAVGTHTHVQTSDEKVSEAGTATLTDLGMTGPTDSILGMAKEEVIERFLTGMHVRLKPGAGPVELCGAVIEVGADGKAHAIERVRVR